MDILVSFTAEVAKYTVAPIGRQAGYLLFYKGNFKKLADRVIDLEGARERVNRSVEEEKRNGKEIYMEVVNWLEKVNELIEKANQLQIDPRQANVGCSRWSFPNLIWRRHQLSRNAAKITKDVVEAKGKEFNGIGYLPDLPDGVPSSSATRVGEKLGTRESLKENIVKALKDPNARNIGVYGLSGVGKTTLVKEIARIAKQDKLFDKVIIAYLSRTSEIETIQVAIAERLGLTFSEVTVVGRADRLRQRIKKEKTILVILDDIWTRLELEEVGIPSSDEHNGYKLLMTSRKKDVLLQMDAQKDFTFRLELLNEAETWSLFQSMVGDVVKDDIRLQNLATQVAQKCGGLPLGIATVARALRNKDICAWKDALRQLENVGNAEMDARIYSVLELSYKWLESDEMRALFLLFAVLPDDRAEYCLKVAMGLDTFKHINTVDDARNRFQKIIGSLKASCLLLEGNSSGWIQMHDSVREVAISIASRDTNVFMVKPKVELEKWPTNDFLRKCSQIILDWCQIHELPQSLDCPNVKFFCLNSANRSLEIPDTIFEGMGNLRVLDLSDLNLSLLPTSFRFLTALQTLCLFKCVLENMNAIEALKNLEFLSFWECSMNKLPSEIGKLTQLRMLDLSHSGIEVIPPNIISSLTKLEELYMGNASIKWEDEISANQNENASLVELQQLSNLTALELQIREAWILPRDLQSVFEKLERYKIAIGDVWDWSDIRDTTLKTLMLKLGTNIHLEHGIKALIKGVENLYLDEVEGIQNVLYQLNWEGFPWLKHLHIQNNAKMKHIVDSAERNQDRDSFPKLETLVLLNLRNLEQICHGPLAVNSFGKLSVIKVKNCVQLKYLLSFSMVKGLSQLSKIEVCQCNSMKKIVLGDINSSADNDIPNEKVEFLCLRSLTLEHLRTLDTFFSYELTSSINERVDTSISAPLISAQVAFPNLDTLKLSSLSLNKIWDDNQHSLDKLTNLIVENCGGLKYLFSSTVVRSFMNLKHLEISNCPMIEEIIATEERNDGISALEEVGFFKLEKIILKDMGSLKTIWHRQFKNLKTLQVNNCEKVVVVFPSSMQKAYNNLEMLEVTDCALVEEIFELTSNENNSVQSTTRLKGINLCGLPKLKKIWSRDPQGTLSFGNLESVRLNECGSLEHLFPLSVATCCSHLMELHIKYCGNMKEIVAESMCTAPIFEFNRLNTLLLWGLYKLEGFYAGNHSLTCPSLRTIDVVLCAKLNLYKTVSTVSPETAQDGKLPVLMRQAFIIEEVIPNLEKLLIDQRDANVILQAQNVGALFTKLTFLGLSGYKNEEATFPYWFLQNVRTLESLVVEWSSFKKIFQDERQVSEKIHTRLKKLYLNQLPRLQHICEEGSRIDPILEFLEYLNVENCPNLTNLLPSSIIFNHLTYLEITNCNGLINLITSSTARSLDKLTRMRVKDCNSLEEIITGGENVGIAFTSLRILMMECLPSLNKFCSGKCFLKFPLLEEVVVRECPRMKMFSERNTNTPNLRKVKIAENGAEWHWKGNLNDTIKNMFEDKVAFRKYKHLTLSEYPELKDLWYGQLHDNVFCNLKSLVVQRCDFLSDILFPSNVLQVLHGLEDLEVRDCDSLETVFDVKGMKSEEMLIKQNTQLKRLTLSSLPKLKHIWNEDPYEIISIGNLCTVKVSMCQSLSYIFSLPLCQDLGHLDVLEIVACGVEEIVAMEEGSMKCSFNFPQLTKLVLRLLKNLKSFYPGKHTLECPSLKILNVYRCEALTMFSFNHLDFQQQPVPVDENHDMLFRQALFSIEKLSPNLEQLAINGTDALRMLSGYHQGNTFHKIELLHLQCFDETPTIFLNDFHAIFPNLVTLLVHNSSFETLFPTKGTIDHLSMQIPKQVRNLLLFELEKLKYIWQEDFPLDHPLLQHLEGLGVINCPTLISLVPSSTTFTNLTSLKVDNCKELIYLMTSSTAKSLVKLTTLKISNCEKMLDVVKIEEEKAEEDIIFENLVHLEFTSLSSVRSFCYGKHTFMFPSLLRFVVKGCPRMKIFSSGVTMAPFLTAIEMENEKMRWKDDLNTTIEQLFIEKVAFGGYQHLKLSEYPELKELWYGQLQHNVFRSLKYLVVHKCDFLSDVLFQPNVLEVLMNLEELDISHCNSLEAVFDLKGQFAEEILVRSSTQLKKLTLSDLPKLKHVWKEDPHNALRFQSLSEVSVATCKSLISLFPLSVARDILGLQNLQVYDCGIEEIVAKEEGMEEIIIFVFPRLISIGLRYLPKLKAFFAGIHSVQCTSLKTVNVFSCPKLEQFMTEPMRHQERARNDKLNVATYQPLFKIEEVLANVENLTLNEKDFDIILQSQYSRVQFSKVKLIKVSKFTIEEAAFPYWFLKNVPCLETLVVRWSSFTEIFQGEGSIGEERETQIGPQLKELALYQLHRLQHICKEGHQMDPVLQLLETIYVQHCSSLIKLVPSSVTFTSLTYLEVTNCNGLINLITCSTAKSLVKLTTMKIKLCNLLEDVVNGKEDETNNEITFCNLQSLELVSLPRLCRFCSCMCPTMFPLLEDVVVEECPRMEIFSLGETSTPNLQNVQTEENDEGYGWEGDLNGTIKKLFNYKVAFCKFKCLTLSEYPELKDLWYGQLHDNVFCNLKSLVVQRCDFLSDILFPSNILQVLHGLEDLVVRDCDSLETVFDVKGMMSKEILIKQSTQLKRLTLSSLPKLKQIWNEDPYEIISFGNLCMVDVSMCESLLNVFPLSLCEDLGHLEVLEIESCGVEEIVAMEKGSMKCSLNFPQLTELALRLLTNLKSFYPEKHTLECPSLKILNVYRCEALRMFSFTHLDFQQQRGPVDENHDMLFQQALFSIEKLNPNLEQLAINGTDALRLLSGYHQGNTFHKIEFLRLQCFDETPTIFLNDFHAIFPSLETLEVRNSSFETLFPTKGTIDHLSMQISKQVRNLWLFELEKLKYIWQEDCPLDHPLLHDLEDLDVCDCPSLISLVPSSTTFTNLTSLTVGNCKELIYLMTSSTAKSLVKLTTLEISNCEKMLDVVKIDEERAGEDIIFENLEYMEFTSLSSLRSFCYGKHTFKFPSLLRFVVKGCPQMKVFSSGVTVAPFLTAIEMENEKMRWKDDLNTTIEQLFIEQQELPHSNDK